MRPISCKSLAEFRRPQTTEESARPTCVSVKPYGEFPLRCFFCVEWGVGRYRWSANKDFKVGTFTANAEELYQHGHKGSKSSALKKEHKMRENDDARSETARYGLRDSDEIQKGINPLRKFMAGQRIDTLSATKEQVKGGRYRAVPTAAMSARSSRT